MDCNVVHMNAQPGAATTEAVTITAADGRELVGTLFLPASGEPTGTAAVLHPATGVNQHLYRKFADYLAGQGWPALTYDLRGSGLSVVSSDKKTPRCGCPTGSSRTSPQRPRG